jgi:hypothetical protein
MILGIFGCFLKSVFVSDKIEYYSSFNFLNTQLRSFNKKIKKIPIFEGNIIPWAHDCRMEGDEKVQ